MYQLTCPACGHVRVGPFVRVEAVVRCVKCGKVFTVTSDLVLRTVAAPPSPPGTIPAPGSVPGSAPGIAPRGAPGVSPDTSTGASAGTVPGVSAPMTPGQTPLATTAPSSLVNPPSQTQAAIQSPSRTGSSILELVRSVMPTHKTSSASLRWRTAMRSRAALIGSAAAGAVVLLGLLIWALSGGEGSAQTKPTRGWANQTLGPVARVSMPAVLLQAGDWQEAGDVPLSATSSFMVLVEEMTWPGGQVSGGGEGPRSATAPAKLPGALPGAVVVKARNVTDQVVVGSVLELVMWTPAPTSLAKAVSRMDLPVLLPRESLTVRVSMPEGLATAGSTLTGRFVGGEPWPEGVAMGMGQVRVLGQSGGDVDHVILEIEPAQGRAVQEVAFELAARDKDDRVVGRWGATGRLTREAGEGAVVELTLPAPVIKADDVRWQAAGVGRPAPERVSKP